MDMVTGMRGIWEERKASPIGDTVSCRIFTPASTSNTSKKGMIRHMYKCLGVGPSTPKKTPRARGGSQWRPAASSCWSWRRSTRPRRKALNVSALTARTRARRRYDCTPERPPGASPGMACTWLPVPDYICQSSGSGMGSECSNPQGLAAPPMTISALAVHYTTLRGHPIFNPILNTFVKCQPL
eukprot:scaffold32710_cov112-Isochrysis_galbana.AAC.1